MRRLDIALVAAFAAALVAGTATSRPRVPAPPRTDRGWLLAADLHVHAFPGDGVLAPRQLRGEAARRNLHVIALTNHNYIVRRQPMPSDTALPLVLSGEEVTMPEAHVLSLGVRPRVPWQHGARAAIDTIVARGGLALLAHPKPGVEARLGKHAMSRLHGLEVANGPDYDSDGSVGARLYRTLRAGSSTVAAIGSSDLHAGAPLGSQRTILLVDEVSERGVHDAVRRGRTAVRFTDAWVGDSAVIRAAQPHPSALFDVRRGSWRVIGVATCLVAWLALLALVLRT